jgi:hypothetical protein
MTLPRCVNCWRPPYQDGVCIVCRCETLGKVIPDTTPDVAPEAPAPSLSRHVDLRSTFEVGASRGPSDTERGTA